MRLLFFIGNLGVGGAERVTATLGNALCARGHDVTLVTLDAAVRDAYQLDQRIRRKVLDLAGRNTGLAKVTALLRRVRALRAAARESGCDAIVAMMRQEALMAIVATFGLNIRVVVSERSAFWMRPIPPFWFHAFRRLYRYSDAQVVQTEEIARRVAEVTGSRNLRVIPNAVHLPIRGTGRIVDPSSVIPDGAKMILAIGSKPKTKGFDMALEAFRRLGPDQDDWHLCLLGMSPDHDWFDDIGIRAEWPERLHAVPAVGNVEDWYQRADIFMLTSRTEGMPNALLEAMATGTACISFDCPTGPRDLIQDGENGSLVSAEDVDALSVGLARLVQDAGMRGRFGTRALRVRETHDADRITDLWEQVIAGPAGKMTDATAENREKTA